MILLGLAGHAGSGKDTVADYLVERYGFIKFSFTDALYREVTEAFDLPHASILHNRDTKEVPTDHLALDLCGDEEFVEVMLAHLACAPEDHTMRTPHSPREILQVWGTQYRRAQDLGYWIRQAERWLDRVLTISPYPELAPQYFVNTSVRFPNEQQWIRECPGGNLWHIHRDSAAQVHGHVSETPLDVLEGERVIHNNYTIEYLHMGIDQLMSTNMPSIRIEPPESMEPPKENI